jgi:hypothetical protein
MNFGEAIFQMKVGAKVARWCNRCEKQRRKDIDRQFIDIIKSFDNA